MKFLTVTKIENKKDKNDIAYKAVTVQASNFIEGLGLVKGQSKTVSCYDAKTVSNATGEEFDIPQHALYNSVIGDKVEGEITSLVTTPYEIEGRMVERITVVTTAGENPIKVANRNLKGVNAQVITSNNSISAVQTENTKIAFASTEE